MTDGENDRSSPREQVRSAKKQPAKNAYAGNTPAQVVVSKKMKKEKTEC